MEPLRRGKHSARPEGKGKGSARPWTPRFPKSAGPTRLIWILIVATVSAMTGSLALFVTHQRGVLSASDASGTMFGASASEPNWLAKSTAEFGHMPIIRIFDVGVPKKNTWTTGSAAINKSAVVISFDIAPSEILSGADDAGLKYFFDSAPRGRAIYYNYGHEPETPYLAHKMTLSDYKAAWAHVVSLADAAHNPYLHSTLILMSWDLSPRSGLSWKWFLPPGGIISTLGWDAYPAGTIENKNPQLTPPAQFMGPAVAASRSAGLPFGFAEFALARADGRPAWLKEVGSYLQSVGALFGTLFNSPLHTHDMLTDQASFAAWRSVVSGSGSGPPAPSPSPSPTPSAPKPAGPAITGLTVQPATFASAGGNHATFRFTLTQRADVTVCILNSHGVVIRTLARPSRKAGVTTIRYYGWGDAGHRVTGQLHALVVASNSRGSRTAETTVTITAP